MPPSRPRVWITGLGLISPIGHGVAEFWEGLLSGRTGTRALDFDWLEGRRFQTKVGAPVTGFDLERWGYTPRDLRFLDPVSQYALAAAHDALVDAGLGVRINEGKSATFTVDGVDTDRVGVVVGSGMGGIAALEASHDRYLKVGGPEGATWLRFGLPMCIPNAAAAQVGIRHAFHGENKCISTACATGTMAIGDAARLIWSGDADVVVAGGTEAALSDHDGLGLMGFDVLKCMSTRNNDGEHASRPFEAQRDGFVFAEGAGIVVLESEAHARARGARGYCEILAYESASDAYSMVQPDPAGQHMRRVIRRTIERAGLSPADIDLVNAHGTATEAGDIVEAASLRDVFGMGSNAPSVTATKSNTGHAISGSGAFEVIATALAIRHGIIPPTANLEVVGEGCELNHVRGEALRRPVRHALKQSFGFGGHAAVLALAEPS